MRGNDHPFQPYQRVVLFRRLAGQDIEPRTRQPALFDRPGQIGLIDKLTAAGVYQEGSGFHA